MFCPICRVDDTRVVDSRLAEDGAAIRRRRMCGQCNHRFTTFERMEEAVIIVLKRSGGREPFDRIKVRSGIAAACKGRASVIGALDEIVDRVEDRARAQGGEIPSASVGGFVLDALREVDEVGYLRFASVYKNFDAAADFERELSELGRLLRGVEPIG